MPKNKELDRILFIPDQHFPYNDKRYWRLLIKVAQCIKFDTIVILGDFIDCYTVSSHSKDPRRMLSLKQEIQTAKVAIKQLEALGAKRYIYTEGNHEDRLWRYIKDKAPELVGGVTVEELLGLKQGPWEFIPYRQSAKVGKIHVIHDIGRAGVNAMRGTLLEMQDNTVFGHTHRLGVIYDGTVTGVTRVCLNAGWGGDVETIDYQHRLKAVKDSMLGFGIGYMESNGVVHCQAVPVIKYKVVVEGQLIKG